MRTLFEAMATLLARRTVKFAQQSKVSKPDPNFADACFDASWADGDVLFTESLTGADGNPRDGYGYQYALALQLGAVKVSASGFCWEPALDALTLSLQCSARDWVRVRELLRAELGVDRDRCLEPLVINSVAPALAADGQRDLAITLVRDCLARTAATKSGREELVAWLAANDVTAGGAALRVREAPMVLDGWLELERAGDSTLGETFARLCPFDRARVPAAPWFGHPLWPLERGDAVEASWFTVHLGAGHVRTGLVFALSRELTGWEWLEDWSDVRGETVKAGGGWSWEVSRLAKFRPHASQPTVQVALRGARFEGDVLADKLVWSWIPGVEAGDVVLVVEREQRHPQPAAIAFTALGSAAFRARAHELMTRLTRLRWHPVSIDASLIPWQPHAQTRFLEADVRDAVRAALLATLPPHEVPRVEALIAEKKQSDVLWLARDGMAAASPLERARSKALGAAANLIAGDEPEVRRILALVDLELVQYAEFI
ncbi:MAG: hypothetical protein U0228_26980 [Myxococcaceae bacterium]